MQQPNSQTTHILYCLIKSSIGVTESDFNYHGFRSRISELRSKLVIKETVKPFKNVFGRDSHFKYHWITNSEKKKAIKLYNSLLK
jgi:hypothetical protein